MRPARTLKFDAIWPATPNWRTGVFTRSSSAPTSARFPSAASRTWTCSASYPSCPTTKTPKTFSTRELLARLRAVIRTFAATLTREYGDRVSKNDRSVKVEFPDHDMHVDVVPARYADVAWEIPDRDGGWERTHPVKFGELTTSRNQDHDGRYIPTVKLVRQTRRALLMESKPGGLFVEIAAYHAFADIPDSSSDDAPGSTAEFYTVALEKMAPILRGHADGSAPLTNPALPNQELHVRATQVEFDAIADEWEQAALDARTAFNSDDEQQAAEQA